MGYCIYQIGAEFRIESAKIPKALRLAKGFIVLRGDRQDQSVLDSNSIDRVFRAMGFDICFDDDGSAFGIEFLAEKLIDQDDFLRAIAPAVSKGSFIDFEDEDCRFWRWWFSGKHMYELDGEIVYQDPPAIEEDE